MGVTPPTGSDGGGGGNRLPPRGRSVLGDETT